MKHHITVYEFIGGFCIMAYGFKGYNAESDTYYFYNQKFVEIDVQDIETIRKIYTLTGHTIGANYAVWDFTY